MVTPAVHLLLKRVEIEPKLERLDVKKGESN